MYHSVAASNGGDAHPYYGTETSPSIFEEQMAFLHANGYSAIGLGEVAALSETHGQMPENLVAITFDDGFQDFYTLAFPILKRHKLTATVFLPTAYVDDSPREFKQKHCLTWSQIRELRQAGIVFGSHTVTHPQLTTLKASELEYEIRASKETIEDHIGDRVESFSYPYAFPEGDTEFQRGLRGLLEKYEYKNGVSTRIGTSGSEDDRFFMKRLPVNSCDDLRLFKAKLDGGYDWLHGVQFTSKVLRARLS